MTRVIVPDLGDFKDVEVIDVLVKPGDAVQLETPLITLETEKATMDVPSSAAGVVKSVAVKKGDRVSKGSVIVEVEGEAVSGSPSTSAAERPQPKTLEPSGADASPPASAPTANRQPPAAAPSSYDFDVVVLGAGPGGYTAAFRAADLGMKVALVERWPQLGGVCLNVGCIPSKALLHAAKVIEDAEAMSSAGLHFGKPQIDATKLREWKNKIVGKLTGGLTTLAKQRKVEVIRGTGKFVSPHEVEVGGNGASRRVSFAHCIIAAGSESIRLPNLPDDPRIIDSTGALELDLPQRMLVDRRRNHRPGDGHRLRRARRQGQRRRTDGWTDAGLRPRSGATPRDGASPSATSSIMVKTKVSKVEAAKDGLRVTFEGEQAPQPQVYDRVLSRRRAQSERP